MTAPPERVEYPTDHVGRVVYIHDILDSTNRAAAGLTPGEAVVARHQTAGRGQHGRAWLDRPGGSLLLSAVLDPPPALRRPVVTTALAAVAVCRAVRELAGQDAAVKWPNDVLIAGRKVCGILTERAAHTVVGIGLNLTQTADDFATLPDATSLLLAGGPPVTVRDAAEAVLRHLDAGYGSLLAGDSSIEREWADRLRLTGRVVVAERIDGPPLVGRLAGLTFAGVELVADGGSAVTLVPETVRQLRAV